MTAEMRTDRRLSVLKQNVVVSIQCRRDVINDMKLRIRGARSSFAGPTPTTVVAEADVLEFLRF